MKSKNELLQKLNELKGLASDATDAYKRSREYLYKALVGTYLWWIDAKKIDGFLDEIYQTNGLAVNDKDKDEKFTRILRVIWNLDWTKGNAATLQQWSLVLREIDKEYTNNRAAYKTNAEQKLYNIIDDAGGIRKFIGADKYYIADLENHKTTSKAGKKNRQQLLDEIKIKEKHVELGKSYFATKARSILNIETNAPIPINSEGYTLALLRKSPSSNSKYSVLATLSDNNLIEDSIIASYKIGKDDLQPSLRLLTEIISTQSVPLAMEKHRAIMQDSFTILSEDKERTKWTQNKRLLFRKKTKDILLSENRAESSVVTIVKPKSFPISIDTDTFLRVNDRTFVENEIIQPRNIALVAADSDTLIRKTKEETAYTHVLGTENKVTGRKRNLYFYPITNIQELSQFQADIDEETLGDAIWGAQVDKIWIEYVNAIFVNNWLAQEGEKFNQSKNKLAQLNFTNQRIKFLYYGENGNFGKHKEFEVGKVEKWAENHKLPVATKDLIPVLNSLSSMDLVGKISIYAYQSALHFEFNTDIASYQIAIPSVSYKGKRTKVGFTYYKENV
jgi:hypothetical protein